MYKNEGWIYDSFCPLRDGYCVSECVFYLYHNNCTLSGAIDSLERIADSLQAIESQMAGMGGNNVDNG